VLQKARAVRYPHFVGDKQMVVGVLTSPALVRA
jgi:hypothetical protein